MMPLLSPRPAPRRAGAFSLVVTLIIVSMLAVVAIGFLSSMSSERVTADAFGNKSRAEQAAQAGVDSAVAILRQAFKDFPDSATVWEKHSVNRDSPDYVGADAYKPTNARTALYNEGTSLYVRAMPDAVNGLPDPSVDNRPGHAFNQGDVDPHVTNADGSDARKLFVLPLTSGAQYTAVNQLYDDWTNPAKRPRVDPKIVSTDKLINPTQVTSRSASDIGYAELNVLRYKGDTQGWLGSPLTTNGTARLAPKTTRIPWVEVHQADGGATTAPVVARYAFWVEDESFRANINYAGLGSGEDPTNPDNRIRRDNTGAVAANLIMDPSTVDLFGPFRVFLSGGNTALAASYAKDLSDTRARYPGASFNEALGFAHTPTLPSALADQLRYLTTTTSSGLNLSRHGTQRVNLNELVYSYKTVPPYTAQEQIDAIVKTIQFHAPNFGQRFYRNVADAHSTTAVSSGTLDAMVVPNNGKPNHNTMYLYKLATNIHDYMDADLVPTFVDGIKDPTTGDYRGFVHSSLYLSPSDPPAIVNPVNNPDGGNLVWAQGKDSAPYLDECAVRYSGGPNGNGKYELDIDYYIEVWNPTTRDVVASDLCRDKNTSPMIRIVHATPWFAANDSNAAQVALPVDPANPPRTSPSEISPLRDFDITIPKTAVFPAGQARVLTTDKLYAGRGIATAQALNNFIFCPRVGTLDTPSTDVYTGPMPTGKTRLVMKGNRGTVGSSDYDTEVIFYSDAGYLDYAPGPLPIYSGSGTAPIYLTKTPPTTTKLYGGSLRANGGSPGGPEPSTLGDPRANNEQLYPDPNYYSGTTVNQPRYFNFSTGTYGTLGYPNVDFTQPDNNSGLFTAWPDYYKFPSPNAPAMDATSALVYVANSPLTSIGQLGDVYDPARFTGPDVRLARGGGRTLKIGQPDDLWSGDSTKASRSWAAWRLADFFCINDAVLQPGLINVNGVARDNGAALRAALTGFKFLDKPALGQPNGITPGTTTTEKRALAVDANSSTPGLDALVTQITKRLTPTDASNPTGTTGYAPYNTGQGPFFERGEFSELPAFGRTTIASTFPPATYTSTDLINGVNMAQVADRGREELFRRLSEMITTRGNVFTVYAMGQALSPAKAVMSTQRLKVTFRLIPKAPNTTGGTTTAAKDFHPASKLVDGVSILERFNADPSLRFAKPDHYDIEILSASKGGG